ncbi:hypothetical protein HBI56_080020 [Parastagonospora nodorum]|uniref:Uncharacterized protein n=1 Tax=Phaeosphaeria nodorum (strain SN15 / ATCC MYA-4574 / FGSC 10173) TaxID=321614 RepID=A0A7U2FKF7_PHANO|nr:hypothetical protein HBH56_106700 [Parastagonospora nodorum]QRD04856.1 hypothetical protein JI435_421870 [Parastagonospora nodorum SN15]KAH3929488.1 hypothetical protein HBH54_123720 [Parastagonospora nodorum]KAH3951530.1 hypothetical protein HBH53_057720 [Parastagonospora nodorum]KAH3975543.1 hypothetical protein HBH52_129160 [Parastagonospora nodorum]
MWGREEKTPKAKRMGIWGRSVVWCRVARLVRGQLVRFGYSMKRKRETNCCVLLWGG